MKNAHINPFTNEAQTIQTHSINVARLAKKFAISPLKDIAYNSGLAHDIGKYQQTFQNRLNGESVKIEHAVAGAKVLSTKEYINKIMEQYCIVGHHTGLPNGGTTYDSKFESTLQGRLKRENEDVSDYKNELRFITEDNQLTKLLTTNCTSKNEWIEHFAFLTRLNFSTLVDADTIDTINAMHEHPYQNKYMQNITQALNKVEAMLQAMPHETSIQQARNRIQRIAFAQLQKNLNEKIYLLNMPTGSGKTLTSLKLALSLAKEKQKRIIYVIPFNGIIDQTYEIFNTLIGQEIDIIRHQSTFQYENLDKKRMTENWDAPFIVTTMVQFFESLVSNERGKCRKLHNLKDSIIIFDEAHLLPESYLQPCLQGIWYCCQYLNTQTILMSATLPNYQQWFHQYVDKSIRCIELITNTSDFKTFKKCNISKLLCSDETLIEHILTNKKVCLIVNNKKDCRKYYHKLKSRFDNVYHLSTYQTAFDRLRILKEIKNNLQTNQPTYVVSTSLIEAGIDLDFEVVYRENSGLDHILQSAGRCNREGKLSSESATTYIFENIVDNPIKRKEVVLGKQLIDKINNTPIEQLIKEYYEQIYNEKTIQMYQLSIYMDKRHIALHPLCIPFADYAKEIKLISDYTESIMIPQSNEMLQKIKYDSLTNNEIQNYLCNVSNKELKWLIENNYIKQTNNNIYYLTDLNNYDKEIGIKLT